VLKRFALSHVFLIVLLLFSIAVSGWTAPLPSVSITGSVRQPLNLTLEDLQKLETITVRLNEVTRDSDYHGTFYFRGIPLKTLLELASIQKEETDFSKLIDLAILVRNKDGKKIALSWGEIFSRNPGEIVLAFSSTPIVPHADCKVCHTPEVYQDWLNVLSRKIGYPKLIIPNDFFADRSLEDVTNIEVVDLHLKIPSKKMKDLFSPGFTLTGEVKHALNISDLASYPHIEGQVKEIGDGRGFHGLKSYGGVPLLELLKKAGLSEDLNQVFVISAPDGYRSLLSIGEVLLSSHGKNVMIADQEANQPLKSNGKFILVLPDDLSADRTVKAVEKIEVITLKPQPKIFIIGMGCADTNLITLEAISTMGKADAFVCPEDLGKRFAKYMGDKPVLFDPMQNAEFIFKKNHPDLSPEQVKEQLEVQRAESMQKIRDALKSGKTLAFLEYGDPTIWGGWMFWLQEFMDRIEVIPGISAFNAANAMIGKHFGCNGSIILTVPQGLIANEAMVKAVAENGDTFVIFIGLTELKKLVPLFQKYYPDTIPVNLVYRAGYSNSEHMIKTSLSQVLEIAEKEQEKHLGLIYIGPCLK
jgi:precorrin-4 methylase